jgi:hypothetical protein
MFISCSELHPNQRTIEFEETIDDSINQRITNIEKLIYAPPDGPGYKMAEKDFMDLNLKNN